MIYFCFGKNDRGIIGTEGALSLHVPLPLPGDPGAVAGILPLHPLSLIHAFDPQILKCSLFGQALFQPTGDQMRFLFSVSYLSVYGGGGDGGKSTRSLHPFRFIFLRPALTHSYTPGRDGSFCQWASRTLLSLHLPVCLHHWALEFFKSSINIS